MTISIQQVSIPDQLHLCRQMQIAVFHQELRLFGMQFPDRYDPFSIYMQIVDSDAVIGTYRIVLANTSFGLPIEETGFQINQFHNNKICEMSRLVILKEKRGKIPFSKIIFSARSIAKQNNASILVVALLPRNLPLFKRHGFSQAGPPLHDPSVESVNSKESVIIPMKTHI